LLSFPNGKQRRFQRCRRPPTEIEDTGYRPFPVGRISGSIALGEIRLILWQVNLLVLRTKKERPCEKEALTAYPLLFRLLLSKMGNNAVSSAAVDP
jgi:hypothetical protein